MRAVARRRRAAEMRVAVARSVFLAPMKRPENTPPGGVILEEGSAWM